MKIIENQTLVLGPPGCVDSETEYLTPLGWKYISNYGGEEVCQYDLTTATCSFVKPTDYIVADCDSMFRIKTKYGLNQMVSEDHRVLWYSKSHGEELGPFISTANELYKESRRVKYPIINLPTTFVPPDKDGIDLTDEEIRVMVAVIADGTFGNSDPEKYANKVCIHIKKQRKKDRLERLLKEANIDYRIYIRPVHGGFSDYIFYPPKKHKEFGEYWWGSSLHQLQIIADEIPYWDGHIRGGNKGANFFTNSQKSADFAQYAFCSTGVTARILTNDRGGVSLEHTVIVSGKTKCGIFGGTVYLDNFEKVSTSDGKMYCFTVPSSFLILRRKGCVFVTGNCGKTSYDLNLIEKWLAEGDSPDRIGFVSFTKKAVAEAVGRATDRFNLKPRQLPFFKTIHAMCFASLGIGKNDVVGKEHYRELGEWLGYRFEGTWDEADGIPIGSEKGDILLFLDNLARVQQKPLREVWEENYTECEWEELERFQEAYQDFKSSKYLLDFTDMLDSYIAMCDSSTVRRAVIDEAQDLSPLQWKVLKHAFQNANEVVISGDDDQAIYKWSGASVDQFLSLGGKRIILDQSYRLPSAIHEAAMNIVSRVENRFDKPFRSRDSVGSVDFLASLDYVELQDESTLFLVRNQFLMKKIHEMFMNKGIPYVNKYGRSSISTTHVKAIRAIEDLRKGREITGDSAKAMYESLHVGHYLERGFKVKMANVKDTDILTFAKLRDEYGLKDLAPWYSALTAIPPATVEYYRRVLANGYGLSVTPKVAMSTIHAAKGGEADHVVLLSDMAYRSNQDYVKRPDDERRVAYVGVTRAKERLTIIQPQGKLFYDYFMETQK